MRYVVGIGAIMKPQSRQQNRFVVSPIRSFDIRDVAHPAGCLEFRFGMGIEAAPGLDLAIVAREAYCGWHYHRTVSLDLERVAH